MGNQIKSVGIIGAGQMGGGIAHVCAMAGYDVYVHDISADTLQEMLATISGNLARQVASGKTTETEREAALARINFAPDMSGLAAMDLVIEAATEDETVKRKIYSAALPAAESRGDPRHQHLFALDHPPGLATDRPERFIGIHFMNPVPR
jgi:3-hydroxybutyryl-CoA dehydrogenase